MLEHVKPESLMIGYIHAGNITEIFSQSMQAFRSLDAANLRFYNSYSSARGPFHEDNRNKIVEMAMSKEKVEWLLFVDTDIEWQPEAPYQLLHMANDTDHRIISGLYFGKPGWSTSWHPQWYMFNEKREFIITPKLDGDPLQKIAGAGMGFCLIHMSVFREFPETDHNWRWFGKDIWTNDGKLEHIGEDLTFFLRLNRLCYPGFERWSNLPVNIIPIYGHRGVVVKHHKEIVFGLDEYLAQDTITKIPTKQDNNWPQKFDELITDKKESEGPHIVIPEELLNAN